VYKNVTRIALDLELQLYSELCLAGRVEELRPTHRLLSPLAKWVQELFFSEAIVLDPPFQRAELVFKGVKGSKKMKPRIVRKYWTQLLIAFGDGYTLDGFKKTEKHFELPENLRQFEARLKRELTICNLFSNQNQSISSIARVLDTNYGGVVTTLIDHGFIRERRRTVKKPEIELSPLLTSKTKQPKTQRLGEAATAVGSEVVVPLIVPDLDEKKLQLMSGILDVKWAEAEKLLWPGRFTTLGLSNRGASS
jgi:hypothetical protein